MENKVSKSFVNQDVLKYFAIACMVLDHVAWFFLDFTTPTAQVMHFFGRMTAPIMCFFIAEGYHYTKNLKKYITRLLIFAIISEVPFILLGFYELDMIFTLLLGLLSIIVYEKEDWSKEKKAVAIIAMLILSIFADWLCFGVLWVLGFHVFRNSKAKSFIAFFVVWLIYLAYAVYSNISGGYASGITDNIIYTLYTLGSIVSFFLLFLYNGRKGHFKASKWIFYVFYPLHLMIIWIVQTFLIK